MNKQLVIHSLCNFVDYFFDDEDDDDDHEIVSQKTIVHKGGIEKEIARGNTLY